MAECERRGGPGTELPGAHHPFLLGRAEPRPNVLISGMRALSGFGNGRRGEWAACDRYIRMIVNRCR